jgi:protein-tyrosine phosphatase
MGIAGQGWGLSPPGPIAILCLDFPAREPMGPKFRLFGAEGNQYDPSPFVSGFGKEGNLMSSTKFKTINFICTGNYYRSRFSEYLFNALAQEKGLEWRATSRGLKTCLVTKNDGAISEFTAYWLTAMNVPFDGERFPIQLSKADLENADHVVAVKEAEHRAMMLEQFPEWADLIEYWHVDDMDCATADEALPVLQSCIEALVDRLATAQQKAQEKSHAAA